MYHNIDKKITVKRPVKIGSLSLNLLFFFSLSLFRCLELGVLAELLPPAPAPDERATPTRIQ